MPLRRRRLPRKGVKPLGQVSHAFANYSLYGAVEPLTGESFLWELPSLNTECFQIFVNQFSQGSAPSLHVLLGDNAACHTAKGLKGPANGGMLPFPPSSPALNPVERLWQDLKGRMAGQGFSSLQALKERGAALLRGYRPQEIRSLTGSAYIIEAVNGLVL